MVRRIHISWHIAWGSVGVVAGAAAAGLLPGSFMQAGVLLSLGTALFVIVLIKRTRAVIVLAVAAGGAIGLWRGDVRQNQLQAYTPYIGQNITMRGTVLEDTSVGPRGDLHIRIGKVRIGSRALHGEVWVSTSIHADIKRGDAVTFNGRLSEGFGSLPASMHRAELTHIQRPYPGDIARRLRDWFAAGVRTAIAEPEASLGIGFLTGQRSTLPEGLEEQLRIVGLTHIVVASGYNLTILVRLARRLFVNISKYLATASAAAMICGFMAITGLSPSMSRAGLVAGLSLAAWYYGRVIHPLVLLPFAAAITVLVNPSYIWGDIGWYLSFCSFVGVMILAPLINHYFWGSGKPGALRQILIETLAAQLITLPLIAFVFGQYSPLALPANLLVVPFVPAAMLCTALAGMAGVLAPGIADFVGLPASLLLGYMTRIVAGLGEVPWAQGELVLGTSQMAACYGVLAAILLFLWRVTQHNFRKDD